MLDLPGVGTAAGDATGITAGATDATRPRHIPIVPSVTFALVNLTDWDYYRDLILGGDSFILLNMHGSFIPVPQGYSASAWFDKILDAISNRYSVWLHIGGYPFYQPWYRNGSLGGSTPQLFQKLASYGKWPKASIGNGSATSATFQRNRESLTPQWYLGTRVDAYGTNTLEPTNVPQSSIVLPLGSVPQLASSTFGTSPVTITPIYNSSDTNNAYYPGLIARVNGTGNAFGFYVHLVPDIRFSEDPTINQDYARALMGILFSVQFSIVYVSSAISSASVSVYVDESNGRTVGLQSAQDLLSRSVSDYQSGRDLQAWAEAIEANMTALSAKPTLFSRISPYLALLGGITGIGLALAGLSVFVSLLVWIASRSRWQKPRTNATANKNHWTYLASGLSVLQ